MPDYGPLEIDKLFDLLTESLLGHLTLCTLSQCDGGKNVITHLVASVSVILSVMVDILPCRSESTTLFVIGDGELR